MPWNIRKFFSSFGMNFWPTPPQLCMLSYGPGFTNQKINFNLQYNWHFANVSDFVLLSRTTKFFIFYKRIYIVIQYKCIIKNLLILTVWAVRENINLAVLQQDLGLIFSCTALAFSKLLIFRTYLIKQTSQVKKYIHCVAWRLQLSRFNRDAPDFYNLTFQSPD
jgi:hypothetical protein